jgi:protein-L-isoaspartate(D-aspartate) O-methyltransferase
MNKPRKRMIEVIRDRYSLDALGVFSAMLQVPREKFVPSSFRHLAYEDEAISIGHGQTISQPYTVAFMTNLLSLKGKERVLEIGTGSGYQAAILSLLAKEVFSIEIIDALAKKAKEKLKRLGYKNVEVRVGSGEYGLKDKAPFDAILITAGVEYIPEELFRQLKDGGVLVAPVGGGADKVMVRYTKKGKKIKKEEFGIFHFVPFIQE